MILRPATPADLPAFERIQSASYAPEYVESRASLLAKWALPGAVFVVATDPDDRVLGYVLAFPWRRNDVPKLDAQCYVAPTHPDVFYLHDLAVHPTARGAGLAARLLDVVLDEARARNFTTVSLVAVPGAAPFWARHGFTPPPLPHPDSLAAYGAAAVYMMRPTSKPSR